MSKGLDHLKELLVRRVLHAGKDVAGFSRYQMGQGMRLVRLAVRRTVVNSLLICLGILSAGLGLRGFLLPNNFVDGGAVGIALLTAGLTGINLAYLLVLINIPFILMGMHVIGRQFAVKTALAILGLAICVAVIPYPQLTDDKLLVAVFGGFFLGAGIGLSVRGGAVIDGTEVLAISLSRKSGLTIGDIILIINLIIFSAAAWLLNLETAMYSVLTYLAASRTVDFVIEGIEEYTGVTIISHKSRQIEHMIQETLGRGVTVYKGERGFGKTGQQEQAMPILFTVITRLEVSKLNAEIEKIDPSAFIVMHSIKDTKGGMIKKRTNL